MIDLVVSVRVKAGCVDDFIRIFKANLPNVHAEQGCIAYYPAVDIDSNMGAQVKDPLVVTILEKWENLEALDAHSVAPHMTTYRERVKDLVESVSIKVLKAA